MSQQPPYPQQPDGPPPYPQQPDGPPPYQQQPGGYPGQQPGYPGQPAPGGQPPYQQGYQQGYPPYQGYGQPGPNWQQPPELSGPAPGVRFAGHGARFGAYILDAIIVGILFSVVFWVAAIAIAGSTFTSFDWQAYSETSRFDSAAALELLRPLLILVPLLFGLGFLSMLYFVAGWAMGGQTLGMRMAGIRVVRDRDGGRIGWGAAIVRLIGYFVSAVPFYLGFIWILIDGRRRGWHDLLAGTVVIQSR